MDELIKRITEKTGISEDQARTAVTTVSGFSEGEAAGSVSRASR